MSPRIQYNNFQLTGLSSVQGKALYSRSTYKETMNIFETVIGIGFFRDPQGLHEQKLTNRLVSKCLESNMTDGYVLGYGGLK